MSAFLEPDLPAWKNAAAYSFGKSPPRQLWAWEFLRRNPQYRAEWAQLVQRCASLIAQHGPFHAWERRKLQGVEAAWDYSPPRHADESLAMWRARIAIHESVDPVRALVPEIAAAKWYLRTMHDPRSSYTERVRFRSVAYPVVWDRLQDIDAPAPGLDGEDGTCAFVFVDLKKPISPQLAHLRGELLTRQRGREIKVDSKKPSWKKLALYLRAFDAKGQGAMPSEIAKELFSDKLNVYEDGYPVSKAVQRMSSQGAYLVKGRYVDLLA